MGTTGRSGLPLYGGMGVDYFALEEFTRVDSSVPIMLEGRRRRSRR
ncbi:hypothetical protein ACFY2M_24625 [Streptomyces sp. NPDC001276]